MGNKAAVEHVDHSVIVAGQRVSALRFLDPRVLALFSALVLFRLLPEGFTVRWSVLTAISSPASFAATANVNFAQEARPDRVYKVRPAHAGRGAPHRGDVEQVALHDFRAQCRQFVGPLVDPVHERPHPQAALKQEARDPVPGGALLSTGSASDGAAGQRRDRRPAARVPT